jgi:hypothetical protein
VAARWGGRGAKSDPRTPVVEGNAPVMDDDIRSQHPSPVGAWARRPLSLQRGRSTDDGGLYRLVSARRRPRRSWTSQRHLRAWLISEWTRALRPRPWARREHQQYSGAVGVHTDEAETELDATAGEGVAEIGSGRTRRRGGTGRRREIGTLLRGGRWDGGDRRGELCLL